jgi:hypothetical protein
MHCHIPCSSKPHLPAEVGSNAATCPVASDLASLSRWAPALPRVPQHRTSPPCRGGHRHYNMSHGPRPRLLAKVSSDIATCPLASDLASLPRWAPALPRVPWLRALSPRGENSGATTSPTAVAGCGPQE